MASETKGLFRSLTRSKSKKKATSAAAHGHSSSTDGGGGLVHQPPSLAAWGQANSAAGAGLAGVGGIGAGGLGRAATLREKTRAQMGGLVPASSSSSAAAAAGSAGPSSSSSGGPHPLPVGSGAAAAAAAVQDQMSRSMSQGQLVSQSPLRPTQPLAELNNSQRSAGDQHRRQPSYPGQSNLPPPESQSKLHGRQPSLPPINVVPAAHARQPSDPSEYSGSSSASHRRLADDDGDDEEADGYGDLLDAYDEDDPRSPTSPVTPRPITTSTAAAAAAKAEAVVREGMQTLKLRDGSTIETPLPPPSSTGPTSAGPCSQTVGQGGGRARARSVSRDLPPSFADAPPVPALPLSNLPPTTTTTTSSSRPAATHSRNLTSGSSIDSSVVRTPPGAASAGLPAGPGELPDDRFVVTLVPPGAGDEAKEKETGGGWGKVKRGLTVRRKEKPAPVSDRPASPPRVAAAPTMHTAATLAMQMASAERKAARARHDSSALGGRSPASSGAKEEARLTESAFM